jgi:threonine synthase
MKCLSTRGEAPPVSLRDAIRAGLAPDGGLYVPERLPPPADLPGPSASTVGLSGIATRMLAPLFADDLPAADLHTLLAEALNFPVPVVPLDDRLAVLELFHGPTFAFKDVGARVLARLLSRFHESGQPALTILVATSGDTGGAVAQAFHGVPRTRVVVLYPHGQVSAVQEAQFTTLGGNVRAVAVEGTFDDCQRLAKQAFASPVLRERAHLTSANSISLGRLLPQMTYYGWAAAAPWVRGPLTVVVPSGNFGNIAAGLMARRLGTPIARLHAATTVNDTVPRYLASGVLEPRPSVPTLANAMDVGDPSNLERIHWMFGGDLDAVRAAMSASVHTDAEVRAAMQELDRTYGYLADPHTAIAYLGARHCLAAGELGQILFLSTAHPAKFGETVEATLGRPIAVPEPLAEAMRRPRQIARIPPALDALAPILS